MKPNRLLLSASAAICLLWPATSDADPHPGSGPSHREHGQSAAPHGEAVRARAPSRHVSASFRTVPTPHRVRPTKGSTMFGQSGAASSDTGVPAPHAPSHLELNHNLKSAQRYQAGVYRPPEGYLEHRWSFGDHLPRPYFIRDYRLTDYALYGLFVPPEGLAWIRVGQDALLIDPSTSEVVQVDYGAFY